MKTRSVGVFTLSGVDGLVLDKVPSCVSVGLERLRAALSRAAVFGFCSSALFVDSIICLLYAGLGQREELEDAVQMDPRELDDGMFSVHELRETDHAFSSGCAW